MVSFRNVPPCFDSWKNRDHSILCFPDGSVFSVHSAKCQEPILWIVLGKCSESALSGIISFSPDATANGLCSNADSDRLTSSRHSWVAQTWKVSTKERFLLIRSSNLSNAGSYQVINTQDAAAHHADSTIGVMLSLQSIQPSIHCTLHPSMMYDSTANSRHQFTSTQILHNAYFESSIFVYCIYIFSWHNL